MSDERELAAFQAALLESLYESTDPADALRRLRDHPDARPFSDYVETFELRGVEIGRQLCHQWTVREPDRSVAKETMLAAVVRRLHAPVEITRVPRKELGAGDVRLRILASGVCGTDRHIVEGDYPVPLPLVIGHEPIGVVVEVGADVTNVQNGDRVGVRWVQATCGACSYCRSDRASYCARPRTWITGGGSHAESMVVASAGCTRLPDDLAPELAAPLFCAGHTVMSGYRRSRPRPSDRVAVLGIGGLGHLAIQVARAKGHEVVAVTRSADKRGEALELGAHYVVVAPDDPGEALAEIGGADVALCTSNALAWTARVATGMRPEGRIVVMAVGPEPLPFPAMSLVASQIDVVGARPTGEAEVVEILDLAARGLVRPRVEVYPLFRINQALTRLAEGSVRYRAVLSIA